VKWFEGALRDTDDGMAMGFPAEMLPEVVGAERAKKNSPILSFFRLPSASRRFEDILEPSVQSRISQAATSDSWAS